ncbi:hypothetical protein [Phaffia rhodozyma]|uniref:Uncharacterized protein n=1 Tax=Phaffia rhodozyma TaxID=264483 RepID=A0A0F7SKP0_PHARH|nr:hypothetical protein [Phaffia rhodozyma]
MSDQPQYAPVTGSGLASSPIVASLPKSFGGEGLTRAELAEKKAKEAAEAAGENKTE